MAERGAAAGRVTAGDKLLDGGGGIAGQQGHLLGDGIGGARLLGHATSAAQEATHTVVDLLQDLGDLLVRRRELIDVALESLGNTKGLP